MSFSVLTAAIGALAGALGAYVAVATLLKGKIVDTVMVSLQNGLGDRVREIVRLGVGDALRSHEMECPLRERVEEHTTGITRLHERVDGLYIPPGRKR